MRHCGPQTRSRAPRNTPWPPRSPTPKAAASAKTRGAGEPLPTGARRPRPDFRRLRPTSGVASRPPAASACAPGRARLAVLSLPPLLPLFSLTEAAAPVASVPVARASWLFLPSWRGGERVGRPRPFQPPGAAHWRGAASVKLRLPGKRGRKCPSPGLWGSLAAARPCSPGRAGPGRGGRVVLRSSPGRGSEAAAGRRFPAPRPCCRPPGKNCLVFFSFCPRRFSRCLALRMFMRKC